MARKTAATRRGAPTTASKATRANLPNAADIEALRESQRMLTALLGNLPGMVYRCAKGEEWTVEFVSDGCLELTGREPDAFTGKTVRTYADLIHPDDRAQVRDAVRQALAARRAYCMEYRIRAGAGLDKWVWERGHGIYSLAGELLGLEGFVTDISERVRAETQLRESEARFRALIDVSSHWYWEADAEHRCTRFEGPYVQGKHAAFDRLIGRQPWTAGIENEGGGYAYRSTCEAHAPLRYVVLQTPPQNGMRAYVEVSGEPVFGVDGGFRGYRGVGRDVTRRRLAEQATRRLGRMYAALSATNEAILRACSPEELYQKVCDAAVHGGKFISTAVILPDPDTAWVRVAACAGIEEQQLRAARISLDESQPEGRGMAGIAFRTRAPAITNDDLHDACARPRRENGLEPGICAAAAIPLLRHGRAAGVLLFYSGEKDAFDDEIVRLLERVGENVSFALDNFEREKAQKRAAQALRDSEERFRSLTHLLSDFFWETDADHRFVMHSISGKPSTVFPPGTHAGKRRWDLPYLSPDESGWRAHRAVLDDHRPFHDFRYSRAAPDGSERHFSISGEPIFDAAGRFQGYRGIGRDITERVRAEAEMRKLSGAIEQTADSVIITDREGRIEYVNAAFERATGYTGAEAVGRRPNLLKSGAHEQSFYARLWSTILAGETFSDVFVNRKKNGELYYEEKTISPLRDDRGGITHFISTGKDISERMQAQERLQHIAHHDVLTGLPNRVLFLDRLEQALMRAQWQAHMVGVMFLDLDRFKNVNDTLGHDVGDALLKAMAGRLQGCVREDASVARLGGDEFAVLLEEVSHAEDISAIARHILGAFTLPFAIQAHELFITTSIGISMYPADGADAATLLKNADAAMYRAKDLGKNNYQFYSADMSAAAFERLTLESSLHRALEREEFVLHYQPQVDLVHGRLVGVEALLRWQHPEFGLLSPTQFIAIAEETGAIVPIGEWVARKALAQLRHWRAAGLPQLRIAVNVSGRQFNEPAFVDTVAQLLEEADLPPEALELEITESMLMRNVGKTRERLRALHRMGVRFAIDDFGTGYSSLSYLHRFSIHTLKIDKSFVRDISDSGGDVEVVKTILMMARGLNLAVIAEGVETRDQLRFLKAHGCHAVQGYLLAQPLSADNMTEHLRQTRFQSWLP